MADPRPYQVGYSFTDFQNNSPSTPLPAPKLDNELEGIATAIAGLVAAVKDVRRADGALQNGVVTYESLALSLQLIFDPTNGELVAAAVEGTAADRVASAASAAAALLSANNADAARILAEAAAASVNLTNYLSKAGNLAGLGSPATARGNLGLGSAAVLNVGGAANEIVQLDGSGKLPAYDGSQLTNIDVVPVGTTIYVNGTTAPTGFVKENGAMLSRATYSRLWAFAQASGNLVTEAQWMDGRYGGFSTGDLATTFRIPDSRGQFIRGWADNGSVDAGRLIYAVQFDELRSHTHTAPGYAGASTFGAGTGGVDTVGAHIDIVISSTGGTETRPRNIAKLACIKY
jgi:hypothetical protein